MKPLDDITKRLFPSLAAYAHKVRRRELLAMVLSVLAVYVIGRDMLRAYRDGVATENMLAVVARVNEIEQQCQQERPRKFILTKAAVQVGAQKREEERRNQP